MRESGERVRTAIRNAGFPFPADRITVNLAPADLRKEGASFDLPIALGILAATGAVTNGRIGPFAYALRHRCPLVDKGGDPFTDRSSSGRACEGVSRFLSASVVRSEPEPIEVRAHADLISPLI